MRNSVHDAVVSYLQDMNHSKVAEKFSGILENNQESEESLIYSEKKAFEIAMNYHENEVSWEEDDNDVSSFQYSVDKAKRLAADESTLLLDMTKDDDELIYSSKKASEIAKEYKDDTDYGIEDVEESTDVLYSKEKAKKLAEEHTSEISRRANDEIKKSTLKTEDSTSMEADILNESAYQYAKEIMDKESLCYLDDPDMSGGLSQYNGRYWERLKESRLRAIAYAYISEADKHKNDNIDIFCKYVSNHVKCLAREKYMSGDCFSEKDFRKIQNHVVFTNCVYDMQTGEQLEFTPDLPYYFAVNAKYMEGNKETPYYDKLKRDATNGNEDSMDMFDLMIAYLMMPQQAKYFFVMANAKDSGKSLLGNIINRLLENHTKCIDPEHLSGRFSFSGVDEAVLLSCLEMNTDKLKKSAVAQIKRITGEQYLRVEAKYKNEVSVRNRSKLLLATNGGIVLPDGMSDDAFYRRVIVIPFIKSQNPDSLQADLDKKIWKERHVIVSKAVRKLRKCMNDDGGIVFPESELSKSFKLSWQRINWLDGTFVKNAFVFTGDPKNKVAINDLEKVYRFFINNQAIDEATLVKCEKNVLVAKVMSHYSGTEKKKSRVKLLSGGDEKVSTNAIRGLKWNDEFLRKIGFHQCY